MSCYRARPPLNRQNPTDSCLAAALDSFSRITPVVPTLRELDLVTTYGVGATGGLNAANLARLKGDLESRHHMKVDLIGTLSMPYDIEDRLKRSHVIIARQIGPTAWH